MQQILAENDGNTYPEKAETAEMTGLYGVAARLAAIYGERASVEIESVQGEGTCVTVRIIR